MTQPYQLQTKPVEPKEDKFKFELSYLLPILASILFGLLCAFVMLPQDTGGVSVAPISEDTPGAPIGNALYFVVLVAVAATVFYLLIKRRNKRIIKGLVVLAMTTAAMLLSLMYLSAVMPYFEGVYYVLIGVAIAITILIDLAIFRFGGVYRNIVVICLGGALGVFFAKFIGLYSALAILAFLAIYDIIAVYKG
ncbi:MAG TPA: presenilin family intramembrane aspartyl protease, partial [Candidatus Acidoferrales bacterium]|nr:presenilin family intramembrane aspartyl protease [Candidatus Acidoferrales bacterium]